MKRQIFRIGTRESRLALIQTRLVADYLEQHGYGTELVPIKTTGDRIQDRPLDAIGGKGLFVKELDLGLLDGRTELSVHSLKDLPMEIPEELPLLGCSPREDPRDVLVLPQGVTEWDRSKPVGCAGKRRACQLRELYPDVEIAPIRGNVETRLRKLDEGQYGALVLAAAGLIRLGLECRISRYFSVEEMIPAAGQGILAVQGRTDMDYEALQGYFDAEAACCALAERAFIRAVGGGCSAPMAAYGALDGDVLTLTGYCCDPDGTNSWRGKIQGRRTDAEQIGLALAARWRAEVSRGR